MATAQPINYRNRGVAASLTRSSIRIRSESEREGYTDQMSQESVIIMAIIGIIVTIIGTGIGLAAILVPGQRAMRRDMSDLRKDIAAMGENTRKDIAALGERVGKVELGLVERIGKLESNLGERIARLEVATEGFIKPQSTPQ